ncbi:unnamed protein product, partial [Owenia fusiformis]
DIRVQRHSVICICESYSKMSQQLIAIMLVLVLVGCPNMGVDASICMPCLTKAMTCGYILKEPKRGNCFIEHDKCKENACKEDKIKKNADCCPKENNSVNG